MIGPAGSAPPTFKRALESLPRPRFGSLARALPCALVGLCLLVPAVARAQAQALDAPRPEEHQSQLWPGASFGWDLRLEAISLFKRYTLAGEEAWFSGQGAGAGASASLHFRPPAAFAGGAARWVELELGVANATHWIAWKEGHGPRSRSDVVQSQSSVVAGLHFASGHWLGESDSAPWSGAVLGLAWLPTYVYFFGNDQFAGEGKFHPAGLRLTVDWGRIRPTAKGRVAGLRAALTWLPYVNSLPTAVSAGVGFVFY